MSANQASFASQAERIRLRLSSMKTSATQVGERLFSPRPDSRPERGVHFTPLRDSSAGGVPTDSVGGSGEFSSASVFAGGGAGELSLFMFTPELQSSLCQGVVSKGLKFCILGAHACPHKSHQKKAMLFVDHLYVAADAKSAFINHHIPSSLLNGHQLSLILNERHTKEDWVRLLHAWNTQAQNDLKSDSYAKVGALMVSIAVTPSRKRRSIYAVDDDISAESAPDLLAVSSSLSESPSANTFEFVFIPPSTEGEDVKMEPDDKLADVVLKWDMLVSNVNKISEAFKQLRRSFGIDVDSLQDKISIVDCRVGNIPKNIGGLEDCLTTWEGISYLHQSLADLTLTLNAMSDKFIEYEKQAMEMKYSGSHSRDSITQIRKGLSEMEVVVTALGEEHEFLMNRIQGDHMTVASSSSINESIRRLGERLQVCESQIASSKHGGVGSSENMITEINDLKAKLKRIDARVPKVNNMMIGGQVFQSKADVELFVSKCMPTNSFHLFHDAVTILESLSGAFQERKEVLSEWYQSSRVGCSAQEARHIASFRTTLPHVFGYCKDGVISAKHKLPAVKKYEDWTTFDQDSGVMNFILRGIDDLKLQITNEIHSTLGDEFPEAIKLASEMHTASHYFICQLCTFITDFVQEMSSTAESPIDEAWELASSCVRKIFDELRRVRAAASNAMAEQNPVTKCALYLWCLVQANRVQKEFLDARFRNHPSIAPVVILHVFRTRVTKVAFKEGLKRLEGRIALLEKKPGGQGGKGNNNNANNANNVGKQEEKK